jgi:hypothetical protein
VDVAPVVLRLPFQGRWITQNSPASRIPSHGTSSFGMTYAIDFVAVDAHGLSGKRGWRAVLSTEDPESFVGFGALILAPAPGTVVVAIDGEPDHEARRSQLSRIPYALSQARRVREGVRAIAGNHVVIAMGQAGPFVLVAHLKQGSVLVTVGSRVDTGQAIGLCGNSGNSTEPHVHVQVTDSITWESARGLPIAFDRGPVNGDHWIPGNGEVFDAG